MQLPSEQGHWENPATLAFFHQQAKQQKKKIYLKFILKKLTE